MRRLFALLALLASLFVVGLACLSQPRAFDGMMMMGVGGGGSGAAATAVFNLTGAGPGWSLTNANLTATKTDSNWNSIGTTGASASSGKKYFELLINVNSFGFTAGGGIGNAVHFSSAVAGADSNSIGVTSDGAIRFGGATITTGAPTFTNSDVVSVAVDLGAQLFWYRVNGGSWSGSASGTGNPATGANGASFAGISAGPYFPWATGDGTDSLTLNSGGSAYSQSVPSGYGNF